MAGEMTVEAWDQQFTRQAGWTRPTRYQLYRRANLLRAADILDVGSGTGAVTEEVAACTNGHVVGVDLDYEMIEYATSRHGRAEYRLGDAHDLPFPTSSFDVTACHFVLLWCRCAGRAAHEMVRVTRPGGSVLICAEPDYGGRIDHPDLPLGQWQAEALRREGADPQMGRRLREIFALPGVRHTDVGLIPGLWNLSTLRSEFDAEWALWERSFSAFVSPQDFARVKASDLAAIESGVRLAFMPVFFALVRV
jgi:SAM-dependent methyltransferase